MITAGKPGVGGMGQRVPACPKAGVGELLVTLSWGWVTAAASGGRPEAPHASNFHSLPGRANPITLLDPLGPPSQPSLIPCLPLGMSKDLPTGPCQPQSCTDLTPSGPISHLCPSVPYSCGPRGTARRVGDPTFFTWPPCQSCPCLPSPRHLH